MKWFLTTLLLVLTVAVITFLFSAWRKEEKKVDTIKKVEILPPFELGMGELCLSGSNSDEEERYCDSGSICLYSECVSPPKGDEEVFITNYTSGTLIMDGQPMLIGPISTTILPGWWLFQNTTDITDGPNDSYFVLSNYIYHVMGKVINLSSPEIGTDQLIDRIIYYNNALHALSGGKLYKGPTEHDVMRGKTDWHWERLDYLRGRDISAVHVIDISLAYDQNTLLLVDKDGCVLTSQVHPIGIGTNIWLEDNISVRGTYSTISQPEKVNKIKLGRNYDNYLTFNFNSVSLYEKGRLSFSVGRVKDAIIDGVDEGTIYVLSTEGDLKRYTKKTVYKYPKGGIALISTKNSSWLVSGYNIIVSGMGPTDVK